MANSSTKSDEIGAIINGSFKTVTEYEIVIDTVDTALTVHTPAATNRVFVTGVWLSEGTAANLTFASGANTKQHTFELAANQALSGHTSLGFYFATKVGEALKVQSSAAIGATVGKNMILRVVEAPHI